VAVVKPCSCYIREDIEEEEEEEEEDNPRVGGLWRNAPR
jgi:hypothetical protein